MSEITDNIREDKKILEYLKKIKEKTSPITILGLSDITKICISLLTFEEQKGITLIVTYNELQAQKLQKDLKKLTKNITYIPRKDIVTYEYDAQSMDILYTRIEGIINLYNKENGIYILSAETLMQPILSKKVMQNKILKIMVANEYNIEQVKEKLVENGYERYDLVEGKGTFSVRGDILDIGITNKRGIRIEFFGDEVDQIRYFDIQSQRSTENIKQIKIYPISEEVEKEPKSSIIEYIAENTTIIFDEISKIKLRAENIIKDNELAVKDLIEKNKAIPYILENMHKIENILLLLEKYQTIKLESQDIILDAQNSITFEHENTKKIDEQFTKLTKQEKENRIYKPKRRETAEFRNAEKISISDLKIGDFVVHKNSGIGQYIGVNTIMADGITKDYIKIKYTGNDVLYIPTNSLDVIRKFIGGGEKPPKLSKLGSKDWENTKNKVKSNLREVARNLIELYAKRRKIKGYAFEPDTPWQKEFEEAFPYTETEDQLRCIQEVKKDMESEKPMDRLLCGDVGYRKNRSSTKGNI